MNLDTVRAVADAVLWEGYLLYPYRATSAKNLIRWQFGVLGPPAAPPGVGEEPAMHTETLLRADAGTRLTVRLRHLQLVRRQVFAGGEPVPDDGAGRLSFDEAVAKETSVGPLTLDALRAGVRQLVRVSGGFDTEPTGVGRIERRRRDLHAELRIRADNPADDLADALAGGWCRLVIDLANTSPDPAADRDTATAVSFLGAHLILSVEDGEFGSVLEPPAGLEVAAAGCRQHRCWPVLAGDSAAPGLCGVVLCSPIILYDHPTIAPESPGNLFDATEIDEILTLRVMTMTDDEKRDARATDPAAAAIIDRCESMTQEDLARLHGTLRDPRFGTPDDPDPIGVPTFVTPTDERPWWDPAVDGSVAPDRDWVPIGGVQVCRGTLVRIRPNRRADAQDLFHAGRPARVTGVHFDVDGRCHVAVVPLDDPAAELHEWYGRYLYFGPDELEPLQAVPIPKE